MASKIEELNAAGADSNCGDGEPIVNGESDFTVGDEDLQSVHNDNSNDDQTAKSATENIVEENATKNNDSLISSSENEEPDKCSNKNSTNSCNSGTQKDDLNIIEDEQDEDDDIQECKDDGANEESDDDEMEEASETQEHNKVNDNKNEVIEIHEILDDDDETEDDDLDDDDSGSKIIELNDSGEGEPDDVMIIEPKENGSINKRPHPNDLAEMDTSNAKKSRLTASEPPRRSIRNISRQSRSYDVDDELSSSTDESDVEEVIPIVDPLAVNVSSSNGRKLKPPSKLPSSSTIVVKDTKRLVEIASKSNSLSVGNKKEPTLVIIDTNSILSGRGPVPVSSSSGGGGKSSSTTNHSMHHNYPALIPMALPAQGMYPSNMRATITPIPLHSTSATTKSTASASFTATSTTPPVLSTLTDDMFVVEAPSFIVPYVYEKPPVKELKQFVNEVKKQVLKQDVDADADKNKDKSDSNEDDPDVEEVPLKDNNTSSGVGGGGGDDEKLTTPYFATPLGKFFIDIGSNLVQEYVQSDLLRQQKRKRDREGGKNPVTNKAIHSLMKTLEFSKENNQPFKVTMRRCEFCNFKTESMLAMAHHLETPHIKNYLYKCNFCPYEVRTPHEILFHMEAEHAIRCRIEKTLSFHQCPNCPFEDNQKGKLSRHLVGCMRKFKPEKNLEPTLDWEPPAKIPRAPKSKQNLNSPFQSLKQSHMQFLSKLPTVSAANNSQLNRNRGRPTLPPTAGWMKTGVPPSKLSNAMHKPQNTVGGSVLMPTNYQFSGSQLYQQQLHSKGKSIHHQPSISITPLPRANTASTTGGGASVGAAGKQSNDANSKNSSFVICEICDGYIKDLEQLRNHMQWIHKVKIHPKMIYNRPPLNCQKCQFRFFTDQGLERHLLGSHGLVTSSMQDAANKSKDAGRCPVCGRVYQWKLLNHVARDHNMTLKPAHLSYKCTVCTATFGMYKQFENHVYSAHSVVTKRTGTDKKAPTANTSANDSGGGKGDHLMKPLKINDEITIIPQPAKQISNSSSSHNNSSNSSKGGSSLTITSSHVSISSNDSQGCR